MTTVYHCNKCNETNPEKFPKDRTTECKSCANARQRIRKMQKRRAAGILPKGEYYHGKPVSTETKQERSKRYHQTYAEKHPERVAAQNEQSREYRRIWMQNYRKQHPEYQLQQNHTRRAKKEQAGCDNINYVMLLKRHGRWCYLCKQRITSKHILNWDHVIPLSRGGSHIPDNIRPTHAICNQRKADKLLSELTDYDRRGP